MKVIIEKLGMNGEGVARFNGKTIFISGALPGEEIDILSTKDFKTYEIATNYKIKNQSQNRVTPPCPYFGVCGGCDLQHLNYSESLKFKQNLVKETLQKIAKINAEVKCTVPSEKVFNYRNKASFPIKYFDNEYKIGYYEKQSHKLTLVNKCEICTEEINRAKLIVENWLFDIKTPNLFKHLVIRFAGNTLQVVLVTYSFNIPNLKSLTESLEKEFKTSLYLNLNKTEYGEILSPNFKHISGEKTLNLCEMGINYQIHPYSFLQVNNYIKEQIYNYVLSNILENENVIDAYAGAGLLTALISKKAKSVVGIEINKPACESAEKLFIENDITNAKIINGKTEDILPTITQNTETIVLDPAKRGCDNKALKAICQSKAEKVIYISCSPQSLARDLIELTKAFSISSVQPFDMFPQTSNVETVVILKRKQL